MYSENNKEDDKKIICCECVEEPFLKSLIFKKDFTGNCSYCDSHNYAIPIDELSEIVERGIDENYQRTPSEPSHLEYRMINDPESDYDWERQGEPITDLIECEAKVPRKVAEDIQEILSEKYQEYGSDWTGEETAFSNESYYEEGNSQRFGWINLIWNFDALDENLKKQNRYFNKSIQNLLNQTFSGLSEIKTKSGLPIIEKIGTGFEISGLYRARAFQSDKEFENALSKPDIEIGPPPPNLAKGGRMNAQGISVFYGATSMSTAIAETRPPVGSKVIVGKFSILETLSLLNLSKFSEIIADGSIFDPEFIKQKDRIKFMKHLEERFTKPVMPNDETTDYITTQVVADYLSQLENPQIDGIIFKSVQGNDGGLNVVLFNKSSNISRNTVFENSKIEVSTYFNTEDGPETYYSICVGTEKELASLKDDLSKNKENCKINLDIKSLKVHHIKGVNYSVDEFDVHFQI